MVLTREGHIISLPSLNNNVSHCDIQVFLFYPKFWRPEWKANGMESETEGPKKTGINFRRKNVLYLTPWRKIMVKEQRW